MDKNYYGKIVLIALKRSSIYLLRCCIIAWVFSCFLYAVEDNTEEKEYIVFKKIVIDGGKFGCNIEAIRAIQQNEKKYLPTKNNRSNIPKEINVGEDGVCSVFPVISEVDNRLFKPFDVFLNKNDTYKKMIYGKEGDRLCRCCYRIISENDYCFYQISKGIFDKKKKVTFCLNCIVYHILHHNPNIMYTREEYRKARFTLLDDYQKEIGVSPVKEVNDIILDYDWQPFNEQEVLKDYAKTTMYQVLQQFHGKIKIVQRDEKIVNDEQKREEEAPVKEEVWDKKIGIFLVIGAVILIGGVVVYKKSKKKRGVLPKQEPTSLRYR